MPFWDRTIEVVVATHPDKDHIGGLRSVLERFETPLLLMEWSEKESTDFEALKALISSKRAENKLRLLQPTQGLRMQLSGVFQAEVLSSHAIIEWLLADQNGDIQASAETQLWDSARVTAGKNTAHINYNEGSIVLLLEINGTRVLLTGDLESLGEQALLRQGVIEQVDILKVGHHGSKTSTSDAFLHALQPETALISVGKKNSYGHPSPEVIDRLRAFSTDIYSTAEQGDIQIVFLNGSYVVLP
jgi:beta-lactamase superfamily II metal-dependent hydrolase